MNLTLRTLNAVEKWSGVNMDYKKPERGYQRVGKRKNWWMRNNCTRPTAGLEKTREFQLGLWASSSHISDILLSQGHFLVSFVNLFC